MPLPDTHPAIIEYSVARACVETLIQHTPAGARHDRLAFLLLRADRFSGLVSDAELERMERPEIVHLHTPLSDAQRAAVNRLHVALYNVCAARAAQVTPSPRASDALPCGNFPVNESE